LPFYSTGAKVCRTPGPTTCLKMLNMEIIKIP